MPSHQSSAINNFPIVGQLRGNWLDSVTTWEDSYIPTEKSNSLTHMGTLCEANFRCSAGKLLNIAKNRRKIELTIENNNKTLENLSDQCLIITNSLTEPIPSTTRQKYKP